MSSIWAHQTVPQEYNKDGNCELAPNYSLRQHASKVTFQQKKNESATYDEEL